jgi:peptidoglycan-associated lipoprotein
LKTQRFWSALMLVTLAVALTAVLGCGKKKTSTLPPADETAPTENTGAPTAQLTATPNVISAGDQVQLRWATTNANTVSIDGIGDVPSVGVKTVTPSESTTYHLLARGGGLTADASASVTVNSPPAISVPSSSMSAEEEFSARVQPVFFD